MRVSLLILTCILSTTKPSTAQFYSLDTPLDLGNPLAYGMNVPIGSDEGLDYLERSALLGDRRASALLAALLQDTPEVDGGLVKSALHFQIATDAGCTDLQALTAAALARLSPDQRMSYQQAVPYWLPPIRDGAVTPIKGRCLSSWWRTW